MNESDKRRTDHKRKVRGAPRASHLHRRRTAYYGRFLAMTMRWTWFVPS